MQLLMGIKNKEEGSTQGVLGIKWNVEHNTIGISVNQMSILEKITKRIILSVMNGIFDLLGILTPFKIHAKILLHMIWAHEPKLDWDEKLPSSIVSEWRGFISDMEYIHKLNFRRTVTPLEAVGKPILVVLADSSGHAYGTIAYVRWKFRKQE